MATQVITRRSRSEVAQLLLIAALSTNHGGTVMAFSVDVPEKWICGGVRPAFIATTDERIYVEDGTPLLTYSALDQWLRINGDVGPEFGYGVWVQDGHVYFDVVDFHDDLTTCEEIGRARGELAVFDMATGQTVTL